MKEGQHLPIDGTYAVLGMDLVSFSALRDEDHAHAMRSLHRWIQESLLFHSIVEGEYRWSPAGDGLYVTFISNAGSRKAIDVAFSILEKVQRSDWISRTSDGARIRMALHASVIQAEHDVGRGTNICEQGVDMTARIVSVSAPSQLLVSKPYVEFYLSGRTDHDFTLGDVQWRTVKNGHHVEVMNVHRDDLGLDNDHAKAMRWHYVGSLSGQTVQDYESVIHDTMRSENPIAAIAAAKRLLDLNEREPVRELCRAIGQEDGASERDHPLSTHLLFQHMPPHVRLSVIEKMQPKHLKRGEMLARVGAQEDRSFFIVSGNIAVEIPGSNTTITVTEGDLIGEFSLWIRYLPRTATLKALTDAFVLELPHDGFRATLESVPDVETLVYGVVKQRIIEDVFNSPTLFPGLSDQVRAELSSSSAECQKHAPGTQLDLCDGTYVMFSGSVEIYPRSDQYFVVQSVGIFGAESVIGIVSSMGNPDGSTALVRRESVAVKIPQAVLLEIQEREPAVRNAWNALWGERMGDIEEAIRNRSKCVGPASMRQPFEDHVKNVPIETD